MRINGRHKIFGITLIAINLVIFIAIPGYPEETPQPNVILITIDALRPDHLSCYGYSKNTSPNIDKLAKDGVLFTNAISQGGWTFASIPSLMTSNYPSTTGIYSPPELCLLDRVNNLPSLLKKQGYETVLISAHPDNLILNSNIFDFYVKILGAKADEVVRQSIIWTTVNQNKRFFIWLHFMDVHDIPPHGFNRDSKTLNSREVNRIVSLYDEAIYYVDSQIGLLLENLNRLGLRKSTLIILTADHGQAIDEHGIFFGHSDLWDCLIRVPLIISYPKLLPENKTVDCQVQLIDIAPTVCDILGVGKPTTFEGKSLFPANEDVSCSPYAFSEHRGPYRNQNSSSKFDTVAKISIRAPPWHLIYTFNKEKEDYKLFNLDRDPEECVDLKEVEKNKFLTLKGKLKTWMKNREKIVTLVQPIAFDEHTREILRSLGYLE